MERTILAGVFLISAAVAAPTALADDLKFDELPKEVKKTVQQQLHGGKITEIERNEKDAKVVYEVEFDRGDEEYEMKVRSDGVLLSLLED